MHTTDPPSSSAHPAHPSPLTAATAPPLWDCLRAARRHDATRRLDWCWLDRAPHAAAVHMGSVPRDILHALLGAAATWSPELDSRLFVQDGILVLQGPVSSLDNCLSSLNQAMRSAGLLAGWRDERFALWPLQADPGRSPALGTLERAATRLWGTWTLGAHANGYVADAQGRPTHLWIGQRSATKSTDPGLLDNLIGGGVPQGQSPHETLVREAWEEAGLTPDQVRGARAVGTLDVLRDMAHGLQRERLFLYDLALDPQVQPCNQDGEVAAFHKLSVAQAVQAAAEGRMTVDAAIATLDFARRHGLLGEAQSVVTPALQALAMPL